MPFHTLGWAESLAAVTDDSLTAVQDDIIPTINGLFTLPKDYWLIALMAMGATMDRAKIVQPSIRQVCDDFVRPVLGTLLPGDNAPVADYRDKPFPLRMNENLDVQVTTTGAGPAVTTAIGWIATGRGIVPAPNGNIYTMRGTGTTTAVAQVWTTCPITWANTLPRGRYSVIGMEAVGTTIKAARLIFPGQTERPGSPGLATNVIRTWDGCFRKGGMGEWGQFDNWNMPLVQVLCNAGDTAQTVWLDIVPMFMQ